MNHTTQSDGYKVQTSVKLGINGQHMVNVRADSVDELIALMDQLSGVAFSLHYTIDALEKGVPSETQAVANVQAQFPQTTQVQPGVVQPQQHQTYGQPPQASNVCPGHGLAWVPRTGNKNGKPWSGKFCAAPQNGPTPQCKPIFQDA